MENVAGQFLAAPGELIGLLVLAFAIFFAVLAVTACVFAKAGPDRGLALGLMTSQRNMGLMLAVTGGVLPKQAWLYFAFAQFPIYLSPFLLDPLARRWRTSPQRQPT